MNDWYGMQQSYNENINRIMECYSCDRDAAVDDVRGFLEFDCDQPGPWEWFLASEAAVNVAEDAVAEEARALFYSVNP